MIKIIFFKKIKYEIEQKNKINDKIKLKYLKFNI